MQRSVWCKAQACPLHEFWWFLERHRSRTDLCEEVVDREIEKCGENVATCSAKGKCGTSCSKEQQKCSKMQRAVGSGKCGRTGKKLAKEVAECCCKCSRECSRKLVENVARCGEV